MGNTFTNTKIIAKGKDNGKPIIIIIYEIKYLILDVLFELYCELKYLLILYAPSIVLRKKVFL